MHLVPWFLWLLPRGYLLIAWVWWPMGLVFMDHQNSCKERNSLNWLSPQHLAQREQTKISFFQYFPERCTFAYFISCCLKAWLPINLNLGADRDPHLWEQILVHPQLLRATKNKVGCFGQSQKTKRQ